jgi:hypothetical protein
MCQRCANDWYVDARRVLDAKIWLMHPLSLVVCGPARRRVCEIGGARLNRSRAIGVTNWTPTLEDPMYLARFSYDVLPANRQRALDAIRQELEAARKGGLEARILIPLTRSHGGAALQFEVDLKNLDQLEQFRHEGVGSKQETRKWMQGFSEILVAPPTVEVLRVDKAGSA